MNLGVNAPVHDVAKNVGAEEILGRVVVLVRLDDELREPVFVPMHPSGRAGGKRRSSLGRARIGNFVRVEGFSQPCSAADLGHADVLV